MCHARVFQCEDEIDGDIWCIKAWNPDGRGSLRIPVEVEVIKV